MMPLKKISKYLPKYQKYVNSLKNKGFSIIGYARKSPGNDNEANRVRCLRSMCDRLVERSLVDAVFTSSCCKAADPLAERDMIKNTDILTTLNVAGDMQDKQLCRAIIISYGKTYLRSPTEEDLKRLLAVSESRGFPGMLGSVDCMHWRWRNCPVALHAQYTSGKEGGATVILEAVASHDLWIWHSFFGVPGSNNDINVLHKSPLFDEVIHGKCTIGEI